eukprot:1157264-Pelagomonas_calceolata.AAC.6
MKNLYSQEKRHVLYRSDDPPLQQKQYQTHFTPMTIKKAGPVFFRNAAFTPTNIELAACAGIECACEIYNYPDGTEPLNSEPPNLDMYICDVCRQTYHWTCMREFG